MAIRKSNAKAKGPISHQPGKGLVVSTTASFPESADEKIVIAKSIVQAVVAAHDAGSMDGENYDIRWPLCMAIDLLEQASRQMDVVHHE